MAESQSKKRILDNNFGHGRFFKRRRGQWGGRSRASINAALAIPPATSAPLAANSGNLAPISNQAVDGTINGQQQQKHRHGRKRRRHRHSSFSGGGDKSLHSLPPAVAAALAIPPKTPESQPVESNEGTSNVQPPDGLQGIPTTSQNGKKKKRKSRRKRRQWKPYYKLTAEERRELEEREEKRAERVRAKRFAHGQPVAPYNTTQFLLRDRELRNGGEPDFGDLDEIVKSIRHHTRSGSYESPVGGGASDSDIGEFSSNESDCSYLEREFDNDWLDEQRQRLEAMTKDDLVKEFMDLQKQYESAQRDMRARRLSYEDQIDILRRENNELRSRQMTTDILKTDIYIKQQGNEHDMNETMSSDKNSLGSAITNEIIVTE